MRAQTGVKNPHNVMVHHSTLCTGEIAAPAYPRVNSAPVCCTSRSHSRCWLARL